MILMNKDLDKDHDGYWVMIRIVMDKDNDNQFQDWLDEDPSSLARLATCIENDKTDEKVMMMMMMMVMVMTMTTKMIMTTITCFDYIDMLQ